MKRELILITSAMIVFLTFFGAVTAHPGHGEHYPEEITNTTPSTPTPAQTTTSTGTSSSTSKSSTKKSTGQKDESGQLENTENQNNENQAEPVEEVNNTTEVNASSDIDPGNSESSLLNPFIIVGGFIVGFAVVGLLVKRGLL